MAQKAVESLKKQLANKDGTGAGCNPCHRRTFFPVPQRGTLVALLGPTLAAVSDKMVSVKNAAQGTAVAVVKAINPNAVKAILPAIIKSAAIVGETDSKPIAEALRKRASPGAADEETLPDKEEGEDLCNCTFNLAYGARILLNQTRLRLKRGQRYGLLGPNNVGQGVVGPVDYFINLLVDELAGDRSYVVDHTGGFDLGLECGLENLFDDGEISPACETSGILPSFTSPTRTRVSGACLVFSRASGSARVL